MQLKERKNGQDKDTYRGADKSLARPGRKQATTTKLKNFESH